MITPENIIVIVSDYFRQPLDKVMSTCRKGDYVKVRQVSMYFIKLYIQGIVLKEIGTKFPGKCNYVDHATVIHAIKKVNGYIETDKYFKRDIDILDKKITELFNLNSVFTHEESEADKFERLWNERERVLVSENKYLKLEVTNLRNEINKLQGTIYAMKLNRRKKIKKDKVIVKLRPLPIYS